MVAKQDLDRRFFYLKFGFAAPKLLLEQIKVKKLGFYHFLEFLIAHILIHMHAHILAHMLAHILANIFAHKLAFLAPFKFLEIIFFP